MKNLFITTALMVALLGSSTVFAEEASVSTDNAVVQQASEVLAFQGVESAALTSSEMETVGAGKVVIAWGLICVSWGNDVCKG